MRELYFQNNRMELRFILEPEFRLESMKDLRSGRIVCSGDSGTLYADRNRLPAARFESCKQEGNHYTLCYRSGDVSIIRELFFMTTLRRSDITIR